MSQSRNLKPINGVASENCVPQSRFRFEPEMDLAAAITTHLGRDLFAGVTDVAERKARARIALIVDKLEGLWASDGTTFADLFQRIYGEPLRLRRVADETTTPTTKAKGKRHAETAF